MTTVQPRLMRMVGPKKPLRSCRLIPSIPPPRRVVGSRLAPICEGFGSEEGLVGCFGWACCIVCCSSPLSSVAPACCTACLRSTALCCEETAGLPGCGVWLFKLDSAAAGS